MGKGRVSGKLKQELFWTNKKNPQKKSYTTPPVIPKIQKISKKNPKPKNPK